MKHERSNRIFSLTGHSPSLKKKKKTTRALKQQRHFWKASILHLVGIIFKKEKEKERTQLACDRKEMIHVQLRCESAHRDSTEKYWEIF